MPYANLQPVFDTAILALAKTDIINCRARVPFIVNLTKKEKIAYLRLGKKEHAFIAQALTHYRQNPILAVPYLPLTEFENDFAAYERLLELHDMVKVLENDLAHTLLALKQECIKSALGFYQSAKKAREHNVPGVDSIVNDLSPMMPGRKKKNPQPANPPLRRSAYIPPSNELKP